MFPTGNTFDNVNNCESITITSEKICAGITTNTRLVKKTLVKPENNSNHELEFTGPFPIIQINDNGTVRFQKLIIDDVTNIFKIKPFFN